MTTIRPAFDNEQVIFNQHAPHPVQSWAWGDFRKKEGHTVVRLLALDLHKPVQVFQLSFHKIPWTPFTVGYLPKCFLPDQEILAKIKEIGRQQQAIFIKLEPQVETTEEALKTLGKLELIRVKSFFAKYSSLINLEKSEAELLADFKPKTRYNIGLARKHGVTVTEDNSDRAFAVYLKLTNETTRRQGFYAHNEKYHQYQWEVLRTAGISHLLTASYKGQILATFMLFIFNKILYYPYGASTRDHKELMAPTLLMWEAIRFGKRHGCESFDLWGNAHPNPPPDHPYYGFHRFKEGFSPRMVEYVGTYDLVINPTLYLIYNLVDKIRWKILRLKAKI